MRFIADLHIHSHFSRATSKQLNPEFLDYWAGIKGIKVVGTGDFTHPGWLQEMKEKFVPEGNGLFKLKQEFRRKPLLGENETRFLLTAEISNIYKKGGQVRKVHNVVFTPGFEDAERINNKLINLGGNLQSDGRPILGLDSRGLLEIVLDCGENNFFVPAHIWTPWFSMLGSRSGFNSLVECYDDLSPYIYAIETGLSTDAPMNWLCSFLDDVTLISNSDAHSPSRLGRNANIFNTELSYQGIIQALKTGSPELFHGTIDMFPQEGKYHYDGHRKCKICWNPFETLKNNSICPVCGKPVTIGVMNRVIKLSDREDIQERPNRLPFHSIIPLDEILAEINGVGTASKKVKQVYEETILKLGDELGVLLNLPLDIIKKESSEALSEAIRRMRNREVYISEGFDGEYGQVKVFKQGEAKEFAGGNLLFQMHATQPPKQRGLIDFNLQGLQKLLKSSTAHSDIAAEPLSEYQSGGYPEGLNPEQKKAVGYTGGPSLILAGPGTGKTKTLISSIDYLIKNGVTEPQQILAITFTNKAALEMIERIGGIPAKGAQKPFVSTFHAFGNSIMKQYCSLFNRTEAFILVNENDKLEILKSIPGVESKRVNEFSRLIAQIKNSGEQQDIEPELQPVFQRYEEVLGGLNAFDFDDLIAKPVELLSKQPEALRHYAGKFRYIFVDEYQDTNQKQYELIRLLTSEGKTNLCVVGDPDQAIYGFRGADVSFINRFIEDFPTAKIFKLKTSYRCSQKILSASSNILNQPAGNFLDGINKGVNINISAQHSDKSEAEFIAREIVKLSGGLSFFSIDSSVSEGVGNDLITSLSDFAVLCRTRHQFGSIIKAFRDHNIPYQVVGDEPFYRSGLFAEIITIFYASLLQPNDRYFTFLTDKNDLAFKQRVKELQAIAKTLSVGELLKLIKNRFFESEEIDENLFKRLIEMGKSFKSSQEFVYALKLGSGADTYDELQECVTIMTLHASKGLEFECVFISGCEQGIIPFNLYNKKTDNDEEKRLLYVGMTRAKKFLYLSYARNRVFRNRKLQLPKSRFLERIEKEFVQELVAGLHLNKGKNDGQLSLF
ncbi:Endonuclease Q, cleaves 5' to damaged DNA bases / ATP-dependent DNA helicase UvrD/PcrA-like protein [hydrothermal vent metagenome]|uniref:DNA 3'-5' helicase n=1 Tax=hydrothermal vent metagenome TaxID=652676 RepID=A0A3B0TWF8_9ZZZZ